MACEFFVEYLVGFSILFTTEVVSKIFPNLNVVGHIAVPAGWGSCLPRLAIFLKNIFTPPPGCIDIFFFQFKPVFNTFLPKEGVDRFCFCVSSALPDGGRFCVFLIFN